MHLESENDGTSKTKSKNLPSMYPQLFPDPGEHLNSLTESKIEANEHIIALRGFEGILTEA